MKTYLSFPAIGLALFMAACQKEAPVAIQDDLSAPADRCGCLPPVAFNATNASDNSVDLEWNSMPEAIAYRIQVASHFSTGDAFDDIIFQETTEGNRITVRDLAPNTRYEYRVTTICGNDKSDDSEIMVFYTADIRHDEPRVKIKKAKRQVALGNQ